MEIDKNKIKELVKILDELNLTELSYSDGKERIKVGKGTFSARSVVSLNNLASAPTKTSVKFNGVKSPMVGTAYLAAEPGAKPFVTVGSKVKKGDTILIIEAMKTMNHVPSTADGIVKEICVEDGHPVEFGQTIIILE